MVFVGKVVEVKDISPWSAPFKESELIDNTEFFDRRADRVTLLWCLQNKTLVCDCEKQENGCCVYMFKDDVQYVEERVLRDGKAFN